VVARLANDAIDRWYAESQPEYEYFSGRDDLRVTFQPCVLSHRSGLVWFVGLTSAIRHSAWHHTRPASPCTKKPKTVIDEWMK